MEAMTETRQNPDPVLPAWTLGWRLRRSLEHAGMDVQEMAEVLEVSRSTLSRWMHDEIPPKRIYLKEWADVTKVTVEWLTEDLPKGTELRPSSTVSAGGGSLTDNNNYGDRRRRRRRRRSTPLPAGGDDQKIFWPGSCGRSLVRGPADNHSYQDFRCDRVVYHPSDVEVKQRLTCVDAEVATGVYLHAEASGRCGASRRRGLTGRRSQ